MPVPQAEHVLDVPVPEPEYLFIGQLEHEPEPAIEYVPALQFKHVLDAVALKAALYLPASQFVHAAWPVKPFHLPAPQSMHRFVVPVPEPE